LGCAVKLNDKKLKKKKKKKKGKERKGKKNKKQKIKIKSKILNLFFLKKKIELEEKVEGNKRQVFKRV
jgi:hypothetical protein